MNRQFRQFMRLRFVLYYNKGKLLNEVKLWYDNKNAIMIVHACMRYTHRAFEERQIPEKSMRDLITGIVRGSM